MPTPIAPMSTNVPLEQWWDMYGALDCFTPCHEAQDWLVRFKGMDPQGIWNRCPRADWMIWILRQPPHGYRYAPIGSAKHRTVVACAADILLDLLAGVDIHIQQFPPTWDPAFAGPAALRAIRAIHPLVRDLRAWATGTDDNQEGNRLGAAIRSAIIEEYQVSLGVDFLHYLDNGIRTISWMAMGSYHGHYEGLYYQATYAMYVYQYMICRAQGIDLDTLLKGGQDVPAGRRMAATLRRHFPTVPPPFDRWTPFPEEATNGKASV